MSWQRKPKEAKFYAVAHGLVPDELKVTGELPIYTDWDYVTGLVVGFKGAVYKSFAKYDEARAYLHDQKTIVQVQRAKAAAAALASRAAGAPTQAQVQQQQKQAPSPSSSGGTGAAGATSAVVPPLRMTTTTTTPSSGMARGPGTGPTAANKPSGANSSRAVVAPASRAVAAPSRVTRVVAPPPRAAPSSSSSSSSSSVSSTSRPQPSATRTGPSPSPSPPPTKRPVPIAKPPSAPVDLDDEDCCERNKDGGDGDDDWSDMRRVRHGRVPVNHLVDARSLPSFVPRDKYLIGDDEAYVEGVCLSHNGMQCAGIGVFFGPGDARNTAARVLPCQGRDAAIVHALLRVFATPDRPVVNEDDDRDGRCRTTAEVHTTSNPLIAAYNGGFVKWKCQQSALEKRATEAKVDPHLAEILAELDEHHCGKRRKIHDEKDDDDGDDAKLQDNDDDDDDTDANKAVNAAFVEKNNGLLTELNRLMMTKSIRLRKATGTEPGVHAARMLAEAGARHNL